MEQGFAVSELLNDEARTSSNKKSDGWDAISEEIEKLKAKEKTYCNDCLIEHLTSILEKRKD